MIRQHSPSVEHSPPIWANGKLRLVVTGQCNIDCFYCHNEGQAKVPVFFDEPLFGRVTELFNIEPPVAVILTGGEPLLHPAIDNYIRRLRQYCESVTMVSNCLLLTEERVAALMDSGLTKFRVGVDSFARIKSRPTSGHVPPVVIMDVVQMLIRRRARIELNIVLTKYNEAEIADLIRFCADNGISAKFFEHVEVIQYGDLANPGRMKERPMVEYATFRSAVYATGVELRESHPVEYGGANSVFEGNGFTLRYCRYLCPYGLCFTSGTRIDPNGAVYVCMEKRGARQIDLSSSAEATAELVRDIVRKGCCR